MHIVPCNMCRLCKVLDPLFYEGWYRSHGTDLSLRLDGTLHEARVDKCIGKLGSVDAVSEVATVVNCADP